jgi:homoserine O-acetyltransferase
LALGGRAIALDQVVKPQTFTFGVPPNELVLESGAKLGPITIVYETYGKLDQDGRNAILVLPGRGGTAHAAGRHTPEGENDGWWNGLIGPGLPFDTDKYFVVCPSGLAGGHRDNKPGSGTTGPHSINPATGKPYGLSFPVFTIRDMARANMELLKGLGVTHLLVVSGVSLGGEQSWEWLVTYPDFVDGVIPVVGRAWSSPWHMGRHFIQRNLVMSDPEWQGGNYYGTDRYPQKGLAMASMLSTVSYSNSHTAFYPNNFDEVNPGDRASSGYMALLNPFKMEKELWDRAMRSAGRGHDANCMLYQDWAGSRMHVARGRSDPSKQLRAQLADALRVAQADVLAMASRTDDSMRPYYNQVMVDILHSLDKKATAHVIDSERGHGGSREYYAMIPAMNAFINGLPGAKKGPAKSTRSGADER